MPSPTCAADTLTVKLSLSMIQTARRSLLSTR